MIRALAEHRLYRHPRTQRFVARHFHRTFWYSFHASRPSAPDTQWLGVKAVKSPLDLWIYQEILTDVRPAVVVECGTFGGGSALYLASVCRLLGSGRVVTVDIEARDDRPEHELITYVHGSSVAAATLEAVHEEVGDDSPVLVVLDSAHDAPHVAAELELYSGLVTPGSYVIVEDTDLNGNPVAPEFGPGPREAVRAFLERHSDFEADRSREKFLVTKNPGGFLRRKGAEGARPSSSRS
jgi:cephalosporin hydroxylase